MELPVEIIIIIATITVSSIILFSICAFILLLRRLAPSSNSTISLGAPRTPTSPHVAVEEQRLVLGNSLNQISMPELIVATKNFAAENIIGDGSFGFVYKARLSSGAAAAVKRLSADVSVFDGFREFQAEVETLGRIRHPNLVHILGFCAVGKDRVLIYELLELGSLDQWLHDPDSVPTLPVTESETSQPSRLSWPTRIHIIRGVATGLEFLHNECRPVIIHRDIKSSNVLLGPGFEARIADFGLARLMSRTHVSTQAAGTYGYMPPEYRDGATVATTRGDVYSFGILMFEVATGRRPNLRIRVDDETQMDLVPWARHMVDIGRVQDILEHMMGNVDIVDENEVRRFLSIAYKCTQHNAKMRPTMGEVVLALNQL